jgi:hypothetical protein
LTEKELPALNPQLRKKKLEPISVLSEADWEKQSQGEGSVKAAGPAFER